MTEKTLSNSFARHMLSDPKNLLVFVGYADPDSPAGKIREAQIGDTVQLSPDIAPQQLNCRVEKFNFSGHASRESLRAYANKVTPKKIILVHGDGEAIEWFKGALSSDMPGCEILTPTPGMSIEL